MSVIQVHKGGMTLNTNTITRRLHHVFSKSIQHVDHSEEILHRDVIYRQSNQRKKNTPSMLYIFTMCLLAGIALFLIIESYKRLKDLSMEINSATSENRFIEILNEVLLEPENPNHMNDGGFTFYLWNSVAKLANLNRMPTQIDADIVRLRLMQELTHDFSSQLSKGLLQCGGVMPPIRGDYSDDIAGTISFNLAFSLASATNFAAGSAPFYCAMSVMGTKTSFVLTKFMTDSAITMATLTSKVTIIKNLMSYAFYILGFVVPSAYVLIKNALSQHDIALIEYRNDIANGHISMTQIDPHADLKIELQNESQDK